MKTLYLAAPYSSPEPAVRAERFAAINHAAAAILSLGYAVFSPITQGHTLGPLLPEELASGHDFWMRQCLAQLPLYDYLLVLTLPGWKTSRGIQQELSWWARHRHEAFFWSGDLNEQFMLLHVHLHQLSQEDLTHAAKH